MGAGISGPPAGAQDAKFQAAYRALRRDGQTQFDLPFAAPDPKAPDWLRTLGEWVRWVFRPIGRALRWITDQMPDAPYARIFLWSVIVLVLAALIWLAVQRFRDGDWRLPRWRRRSLAEEGEAEQWAPEAAPAHAWLEEADGLAARGDYAEAVHHLLRRSIEDIERRRPHLVRPASTSRDVASAQAIPATARAVFGDIVAVVERSLFGQRPVTAEEWAATREAYAAFALPRNWRA